MAKENMFVRHSFRTAIERLTDAEKGRLFQAMLDYSADGTEQDLGGCERIVWPIAKEMIDADETRYENAMEQRRLAGLKSAEARANERQRSLTAGNGEQPTPTPTSTPTSTTTPTSASTKDGVTGGAGGPSCAEVCSAGSVPVFELPLNSGTYSVTDKDVAEWRELYPAVDVVQELRKMKGWLNANPRKRKTKSGIRRFVNGWLAREQDSGKARAAPSYGADENVFLTMLEEERAKNGQG